MVCCNECWLQTSLFQRAVLSVLTTPARDGGLLVGPLLFERFWPDFLRPTSGQPVETDDIYEPTPEDLQEPPAPKETPPGAHVSDLINARNRSRQQRETDE